MEKKMFKKMSFLVAAFAMLSIAAYAGDTKCCCETACKVKKEKCCVCEKTCTKCCDACETKCRCKKVRCRCEAKCCECKTKCCCKNKCRCETKCCETKCKVVKQRKCCLVPVCEVKCFCIFDLFKPKRCVPCCEQHEITTPESEEKSPEPPVSVEPTPANAV